MFNISLAIEKIPEINKKQNEKIVLNSFKGKKINDTRKYFEFLDKILESPTHSACLNAKIDFIISNHSIEGVQENEPLVLSQNDDSTDLITKIASDYEKYNGFAFEVIKSRFGGLGSIEHIPFSKLFFDEEKIYFFENNELTELKKFDEKTKEGVYVYKNCKLVETPKPTYFSAFTSIQSEIAIQDFHLSNITNGFSAGALVNFVEEVESSEEDKKKRANKIRQRLTGEANGGSIHVNFSTSEATKPTIQTFAPTNLDKQYHEVSTQCRNRIVTSHGVVSGELVGIAREGGIFQSDSLKEAYNIFTQTYILNRQRVLEQSINYIFKIFESNYKLVLKPKQLFAVDVDVQNPTLKAFSTLSPLILTKIVDSMTTEEIRTLVGLPSQPVSGLKPSIEL
jgi:hypothetical protein